MTDDELIEAVAKVMAENNVKERQDWSKLTKEQKGWWLSDAKYAIAVARPIIREQERELLAKKFETLKISQMVGADIAYIIRNMSGDAG